MIESAPKSTLGMMVVLGSLWGLSEAAMGMGILRIAGRRVPDPQFLSFPVLSARVAHRDHRCPSGPPPRPVGRFGAGGMHCGDLPEESHLIRYVWRQYVAWDEPLDHGGQFRAGPGPACDGRSG